MQHPCPTQLCHDCQVQLLRGLFSFDLSLLQETSGGCHCTRRTCSASASAVVSLLLACDAVLHAQLKSLRVQASSKPARHGMACLQSCCCSGAHLLRMCLNAIACSVEQQRGLAA